MYGVRRMISTTSSMVKRMPASCAIAGRCRPALVEPPVAPTTTAAFSSARRVTMSRGRSRLSSSAITARPEFDRPAVAVLIGRRRAGRAGQREADRLADHRHGVGGELSAARAGRRTRHAFQLVQLRVRHLAGGVLADRLEHIHHRHVAVLEPSGQDRAAIHEHAGHVQPHHRHHHARQRLVAAGEPDQRVVAMPAHGEFHRVRDQVARHQRGLHALVAHRDAVGHRDGGEFARRAAGLVHALLHRLRLARRARCCRAPPRSSRWRRRRRAGRSPPRSGPSRSSSCDAARGRAPPSRGATACATCPSGG